MDVNRLNSFWVLKIKIQNIIQIFTIFYIFERITLQKTKLALKWIIETFNVLIIVKRTILYCFKEKLYFNIEKYKNLNNYLDEMTSVFSNTFLFNLIIVNFYIIQLRQVEVFYQSYQPYQSYQNFTNTFMSYLIRSLNDQDGYH